MRNVFKIFFSDIGSLLKQFFAVCVAIAIIILPALYAWVNIYANENPYGNTGNVPIAVASDDAGYEGNNKGKDILDGLRENKSIKWVFLDSSKDAIDGVKSGKYYAAIVINENLSRNMYDLKSALQGKDAPITYYSNAKKNPVAVKITDTAAETVEHNIQVEYLKVLFETVLKKTQEKGGEIKDQQTVDALVKQLESLSKNLRTYSKAVGGFVNDSANLSSILSGVGASASNASSSLQGSKGQIANAQSAIANAENSIDTLGKGMDNKLAQLQTDLESVSAELDKIASSEVINSALEMRNEAVTRGINSCKNLQSHLEALRSLLPKESALSGVSVVSQTLDSMIERTKTMEQQLNLLYDDEAYATDAKNITDACADTVAVTRSLMTDTLSPAIDDMLSSLRQSLSLLYPLIDSLGITLDDVAPVVDAAGDTVGYVAQSMQRLQSLLNKAADTVDKIKDNVLQKANDDRLQTLLTLLQGDAEKYAEFLSAPVKVNETSIYPVKDYGSAMAPFYSALGIWVGGVILATILKPEAEPKGLRYVTEGQKFWGRFLLFFLFGQLQAAVIAFGDVYLLGVQCQNIYLFWLACAVASLAFTSVIYALALAFGDFGKAFVVIVMIVQIAGSSGSFPIELLPDIFAKIYKFFPFPYAINAMRETICGMYGYDLWIYLGELMIFTILGFVIGLVVRKPFVHLNEYVEGEIERSGVL